MRDVRLDPSLPYAPHTRGRNAWSIGISIAAMQGATPSDFGRFPITEPQLDAMCRVAATLARFYGIDVAAIRTHAEAALDDGYFGAEGDDVRWDIARLRPSAEPLHPSDDDRRLVPGEDRRTAIMEGAAFGKEHAPLSNQTASSGQAPSTILLIRHAEKPGETKHREVLDADAKDPKLSLQGRNRAAAYAAYFSAKWPGGPFPGIDAIFATANSDASHRPAETVAPLAAALGIQPNENYGNSDKDIAKLAGDLLGGKYAGKVVLICWHHGTLQTLAHALGATSAPPWPSPTTFDLVWRLDYANGSTPAFTALYEGLMFGDEPATLPLQPATVSAS